MKVMTIFGTRPEAIKMAPVIKKLNESSKIEHRSCVTAQHREMLDQVLKVFDIVPDYDLDIFKNGQTLTDITINALSKLEGVIEDFKPDVILVQGDTTTVFAGGLAAFYNGVKVGHIEAGLRSGNIYSPFPEEANRKMTGIVTNYHFAPTETSKLNLLGEGYSSENIFITGNTSIDALLEITKNDYTFENEVLKNIDFENKKVILVTCHRRENLGEPMKNIFYSLNKVVEENEDVELVFPMHLNPKVRELANEYFGENKKVHLIEPLDYLPFANLQKKSYLIVTDSGGIQEEAPTLGKPILVVRCETERPEGIEAGTAKLVGVDRKAIYTETSRLINNSEEYKKMSIAKNPYGDGTASEKIVGILEKQIKNK